MHFLGGKLALGNGTKRYSKSGALETPFVSLLFLVLSGSNSVEIIWLVQIPSLHFMVSYWIIYHPVGFGVKIKKRKKAPKRNCNWNQVENLVTNPHPKSIAFQQWSTEIPSKIVLKCRAFFGEIFSSICSTPDKNLDLHCENGWSPGVLRCFFPKSQGNSPIQTALEDLRY